jgi:hypothetical protein
MRILEFCALLAGTPLLQRMSLHLTMVTPSVAVIGGGPGGMFFCHALETRRRELMERGDEAGLASLPTVTCFERAPAPGGVWRSERTFAAGKQEEKKEAGAAPIMTNMCK